MPAPEVQQGTTTEHLNARIGELVAPIGQAGLAHLLGSPRDHNIILNGDGYDNSGIATITTVTRREGGRDLGDVTVAYLPGGDYFELSFSYLPQAPSTQPLETIQRLESVVLSLPSYNRYALSALDALSQNARRPSKVVKELLGDDCFVSSAHVAIALVDKEGPYYVEARRRRGGEADEFVRRFSYLPRHDCFAEQPSDPPKMVYGHFFAEPLLAFLGDLVSIVPGSLLHTG
jgi:hypothetical protein